jgi:DNA-binding NarL/FixJ family response regulator
LGQRNPERKVPGVWGSVPVAHSIQVVSSHPVLIRAACRILAHAKHSNVQGLHSVVSGTGAIIESGSPRLFILDLCSLRSDAGRFAQRCRAQAPGSKFLALLPEEVSHEEMLRLFYCGIDGLLKLHRNWQAELPLAVQCIQGGNIWAPSEVLAAFVKQAKALLHVQLLPGHSLTAREGQVLQFLLRGLTNREISGALEISERTVKFHVSNVLGKLQLQDRRGLREYERFAASHI